VQQVVGSSLSMGLRNGVMGLGARRGPKPRAPSGDCRPQSAGRPVIAALRRSRRTVPTTIGERPLSHAAGPTAGLPTMTVP
jgi:hypothetical protein